MRGRQGERSEGILRYVEQASRRLTKQKPEKKVPPVPIPNTAVKLSRVESTWLEAAREDRLLPVKDRSPRTLRAGAFSVGAVRY